MTDAHKETSLPPALRLSLSHAQSVLETLRREDPALAETLKTVLPGYALQQARAGQSVTRAALRADALKGADWFKEQRAQRIARSNSPSKTPLEIYREIVDAFPKPQEKWRPSGGSLLFCACRDGDLDKVKALHQSGVDITAESSEALMIAARKGHLPVVEYLHKHGADIREPHNLVLIEAAGNGHVPVVEYLHQHGADITARDNSALIESARNGHVPVVQYLHQHGADITAQNNRALTIASHNSNLPYVHYLHQHGADISSLKLWGRERYFPIRVPQSMQSWQHCAFNMMSMKKILTRRWRLP